MSVSANVFNAAISFLRSFFDHIRSYALQGTTIGVPYGILDGALAVVTRFLIPVPRGQARFIGDSSGVGDGVLRR